MLNAFLVAAEGWEPRASPCRLGAHARHKPPLTGPFSPWLFWKQGAKENKGRLELGAGTWRGAAVATNCCSGGLSPADSREGTQPPARGRAWERC